MWRNTGQPVRVLMLDARACLPVLLAAVYWSWTTLYIAIPGVVFFTLISFFGLTLPALTRTLRRWVAGSIRTAVPAWRRRRFA
jgi:intracellular multiplication protein IcmT